MNPPGNLAEYHPFSNRRRKWKGLAEREACLQPATPMQLTEMHPRGLFFFIWMGAGWFPSADERAVFFS